MAILDHRKRQVIGHLFQLGLYSHLFPHRPGGIYSLVSHQPGPLQVLPERRPSQLFDRSGGVHAVSAGAASDDR